MSNELKIGLTVILAVFAAYIGIRFMSDIPLFRQSQEITATFDRVDGLNTGNLVYLNGVKIGSVQAIALESGNQVRVHMVIEVNTHIPVDSRALLTSYGLFDGKAIVIERGSSSEEIVSGDEIEGYYVDSLMESLGDTGQEIGEGVSGSFGELELFLEGLNEVLNDQSRESLQQSISSVETTTSALARVLSSRQQELESAIASTNRMISRLDSLSEDNRPRVDSIVTNLEATAGELEKLSRELDTTVLHINDILAKINEGEGTVGRLVNDPSLYHNADSLSVELKKLIQGINENPGRYLRHLNLIEVF